MVEVDEALVSKFLADTGADGIATLATGGIFNLQAPQDTPAPYLIFQDVMGEPQYTFAHEDHRLLEYRFRLYDEGMSFDLVDLMARRLEAILNDGSLTISGWSLFYCRQRRRFPLLETEQDRTYPVIVAEYDLKINPA